MPASLIEPFAKYQNFLVAAFGQHTGEQLFDIGIALESMEQQEAYFNTIVEDLKRIHSGDTKGHSIIEKGYKFEPVDCETFIRDKFYMGLDKEIYPGIVPYLKEMNSGKYIEIVLTGGIGSAKTTMALWTQAYQLYLLSALRNPHAVYGQDRSSEIEVIFQSITATLAEQLDYGRFKSLILRSPYFLKHFPPDLGIKSQLNFPNRVIVKPVSGSNLATIGQNVIGGLIDELNYMSVVDKSKKSVDAGTYDQAVALYNSISRRRKSRFLSEGRMPGILCLVSSKKYPGQFTDIKAEEAKTDKTIYVYDKRVWDIKPDAFSNKRFRVFIGDDLRKPKIIEPDEVIAKADSHLVIEVPIDFMTDFKKDIVNALREVAGVSHLSKYPFFTNAEALKNSFSDKYVSVFSRDTINFDDMGLGIVKKAIRNPDYPRFAHVDLALTGDSAGLAIAHCPGFQKSLTGERMPIIRVDGALEIKPPPSGEIPFWKIRKLFYMLRDLGMNIKWITFDTFQSADSIQVLRQRGFYVGNQSVDTSMEPYDFYKSAVYDGRMQCPVHPVMFREAKDLQVDTKKQKVDHLPTGSKDVTDAIAGAVFGLTLRRETWTMHGVPTSEIPQDIMAAARKTDKKVKAAEVIEEVAEDDED